MVADIGPGPARCHMQFQGSSCDSDVMQKSNLNIGQTINWPDQNFCFLTVLVLLIMPINIVDDDCLNGWLIGWFIIKSKFLIGLSSPICDSAAYAPDTYNSWWNSLYSQQLCSYDIDNFAGFDIGFHLTFRLVNPYAKILESCDIEAFVLQSWC